MVSEMGEAPATECLVQGEGHRASEGPGARVPARACDVRVGLRVEVRICCAAGTIPDGASFSPLGALGGLCRRRRMR